MSNTFAMQENVDVRAPAGFLPALKDRPHPQRRRAITAAHPQVKTLIAPDPITAVIILAVVFGQTAIAALFGHLGLAYWWLLLVAAYGIGAFANHAMFVAIHDATHGAIFHSPRMNKIFLII